MDDLDGKVAVVTGAGSGIGRALARRFAAEGMAVVASDVQADALESTVELIAGDRPGAAVRAVAADVSRAEEVEALAEAAYGAFGAVDVLCNNAGVFVGGFLWERTPADVEFTLGVNLWGVLHGIRSFVPRMVAQGTEARIVNTVSVAGLLGSPYAGPYGISKFAALAATESLAGDLEAIGSQVRAQALCPGMVSTAIATSERNRPAELAAPTTDDQRFVRDVLEETVSAGMDPAEVAGIVVDGLRSDDFLILTHPEFADQVVARAAALARRARPGGPEFL